MVSSLRCARLLLWSLIALLVLAACAPVKEAPPVDPQAWAREAQARIADGDFAAAAQLYLDQAAVAQGETASEWRLQAGQILLDGGLSERAWAVLSPEAMVQGNAQQRASARLLLAEHFAAQEAIERALEALGDPITDGDDAQRLRMLQLQAQYYRDVDAPDRALLAEARALPWLPPQARVETTLVIWQAFASGEDAQAVAHHPEFQPWLDMAGILRVAALDAARLQTAVQTWALRYAEHPATPWLAAHVLEQFGAGGLMPSQIAVLLPLSGRLNAAGAAIRDGILAAWYRLPAAERPAIAFHDTAAIPANNLYAEALGAGAEAVIGPLRKEDLRLLAFGGEPPIPVLALNHDPSIVAPPRRLFQFGLSPEDEAAVAAGRMAQEGYLRALALTPEGDWGERVAQQFVARYAAFGGVILTEQRFAPGQKDFSAVIQAALGLDLSRERARALMGLLGERLEFEPRRRQDVAAIFLAAPAWQARLIKPQLNFHRAGDVPVYALSQVYSGQPDAEADRDLDGLRFTDAPWIIGAGGMAAERSRVEAALPGPDPRYARFHALGYDALNLLPRLTAMRLAVGQRIPGATGALYSDANGVLHRTLPWAEFRHGVPLLLPPRPEPIPPDAFRSETAAAPREGTLFAPPPWLDDVLDASTPAP